jgi:hypothetical protein
VTKDEALQYLTTWPKWTEPSAFFVRNTLAQAGVASRQDVVTHTTMRTEAVALHERGQLALIRQLARIADVAITVHRYRGQCGRGFVEKRYACFTDGSGRQHHLRVDLMNFEARDAVTQHYSMLRKAEGRAEFERKLRRASGEG